MQYSEALLSGKNVSIAEALETGGVTTLTGLSIVFGVLVILMIMLYLFKVVFYKDPAKTAAKAPAPVEEAPAVEEAVAEEEDEEELIAILTAAVAASLNTSTYNLHIKSYRRVDNKRPAWNNAGLRETIGNRF